MVHAAKERQARYATVNSFGFRPMQDVEAERHSDRGITSLLRLEHMISFGLGRIIEY